ncbi:hypothetical protein N7494_009161 [Penicillium frequentans]|uniref:Microbial-type PARG catalytic domain-containing protein n=1 Tax=Penicillium frequentans TaxID=3151616 RepID=A0AAD6GD32_9EURO|nr:hypothetical protein N7494_009161 [Penicillium glabrum]
MSTPAEEVAMPEGPPAAGARLRARVPLKPVRKRKSPAENLMGDLMSIISEETEVSDDSEGTRRVKALNIKAKPTTLTKVTSQDSFDAALKLLNAKNFIGADSGEDVCVLHVASPQKLGAGLQKSGGDWKDGSTGHEAQLFYRSTISETLRPEYFLILEEKIQCIKSPNMIIFQEHEEVENSWMWVNKQHVLVSRDNRLSVVI